jgi:hypothetical protein
MFFLKMALFQTHSCQLCNIRKLHFNRKGVNIYRPRTELLLPTLSLYTHTQWSYHLNFGPPSIHLPDSTGKLYRSLWRNAQHSISKQAKLNFYSIFTIIVSLLFKKWVYNSQSFPGQPQAATIQNMQHNTTQHNTTHCLLPDTPLPGYLSEKSIRGAIRSLGTYSTESKKLSPDIYSTNASNMLRASQKQNQILSKVFCTTVWSTEVIEIALQNAVPDVTHST